MKKLIFSLLFLVAGLSFAQTTVSSTSLSAAMTTTSGQTVSVVSATGITVAPPTMLFIEGEAMDVKGINGTTLTVVRGTDGTAARTHLTGAHVFLGPPAAFSHVGKTGSCTATNEFSPTINVRTGDRFSCTGGIWIKLVDNTFTYPQTALTAASYTNATTTFSNVPGLTFAIDASKSYTIVCRITWQGSAATAGPKYQFTGPASPTAVTVGMDSKVTATTTITQSAVAFSSAVANTGTVTTATNFPDTLSLSVINGVTPGTIQLQAAANGTGTLTIAAGSHCTMTGQ